MKQKFLDNLAKPQLHGKSLDIGFKRKSKVLWSGLAGWGGLAGQPGLAQPSLARQGAEIISQPVMSADKGCQAEETYARLYT